MITLQQRFSVTADVDHADVGFICRGVGSLSSLTVSTGTTGVVLLLCMLFPLRLQFYAYNAHVITAIARSGPIFETPHRRDLLRCL